MGRAANDNERAFAELYNRYAKRLQSFLYRQLGGDSELAADYTHDVFLRIYDARSRFRQDQSFQTWLFSVAYNLCKNRYRHIQAEAKVMAQIERQSEVEQPDVEVRLNREELAEALRNVLNELPAEARMLFALRFEEELSVVSFLGRPLPRFGLSSTTS